MKNTFHHGVHARPKAQSLRRSRCPFYRPSILLCAPHATAKSRSSWASIGEWRSVSVLSDGPFRASPRLDGGRLPNTLSGLGLEALRPPRKKEPPAWTGPLSRHVGSSRRPSIRGSATSPRLLMPEAARTRCSCAQRPSSRTGTRAPCGSTCGTAGPNRTGSPRARRARGSPSCTLESRP